MTRRMMMVGAAALLLAGGACVPARAQPAGVPRAIYTDPPADKDHPARMEVLHIPSGGVAINGVAYVAAGPGPHPVAVVLHGLPGNEKNLDLAQAIRRAGWTVVTFNYRGSWGSPGAFSFRGNLEDARAVLAYVRRPEVAAKIGGDPKRIAIMGHSMGGWVTSQVAASDPDILGAALISAGDMGRLSGAPEAVRLGTARENMESLSGTVEGIAAQFLTLGDATFASAAPGLAKHPLLVLTSDDGLAPASEALFLKVKQGGGRAAIVHVATDHGWSSARIRLQTEILNWLATLTK